MLFHLSCCVITAFGNMQPSRQMCCNFFVTLPAPSRIHKPMKREFEGKIPARIQGDHAVLGWATLAEQAARLRCGEAECSPPAKQTETRVPLVISENSRPVGAKEDSKLRHEPIRFRRAESPGSASSFVRPAKTFCWRDKLHGTGDSNRRVVR